MAAFTPTHEWQVVLPEHEPLPGDLQTRGNFETGLKEARIAREPDLNEAQRFLDLLDPDAERFTFQVFDDSPQKLRSLAKVTSGELIICAYELRKLQEAGAGVFVTINATAGGRRKALDVERVRAVFADLDGAPLDPVMACDLEPHMVVESSPGRFHAYWLVEGLPLDQFEPIQKAIAARFGSDPKVCDLSRVMRLPGYWHQKAAPFRSRVDRVNERLPYTVAQITAEFPPVRSTGGHASGDGHADAPAEFADLVIQVMTSESYHDPLVRMAYRLVADGMPKTKVRAIMEGLMNSAAGPRDDRWRARFNDIPRSIETAEVKIRGEDLPRRLDEARARLDGLRPVNTMADVAALLKDPAAVAAAALLDQHDDQYMLLLEDEVRQIKGALSRWKKMVRKAGTAEAQSVLGSLTDRILERLRTMKPVCKNRDGTVTFEGQGALKHTQVFPDKALILELATVGGAPGDEMWGNQAFNNLIKAAWGELRKDIADEEDDAAVLHADAAETFKQHVSAMFAHPVWGETGTIWQGSKRPLGATLACSAAYKPGEWVRSQTYYAAGLVRIIGHEPDGTEIFTFKLAARHDLAAQLSPIAHRAIADMGQGKFTARCRLHGIRVTDQDAPGATRIKFPGHRRERWIEFTEEFTAELDLSQPIAGVLAAKKVEPEPVGYLKKPGGPKG